ncbi:Crp/Fnr family transcriptional regulator [Aquimarina longa]|uniref:Crp/Fnr family transcriptional regulator n=1 Tax=Aquimarina longa TaxID=1080221 RepID=UPI000783E34F|nr:Crp/Fnr family transcriptional regulator [Aquimarina longa]
MNWTSLELLNILTKNDIYMHSTYTLNEYIVHKEDIVDNISFIVEGVVKVSCINENGHEVIVAILHKNQTFGGSETFKNSNVSYNFKSIDKKTIIHKFSMNSIHEIIRQNNHLQKDLFLIWKEKHRLFEERIRVLNIKSTPLRLIEVFVEFKEKFGHSCPDSENIIINSPLDQEELANYIRTSRVSVNIIIQKLKYKSLIKYQQQKIVLKKEFFNYLSV